MIRKPARLSEAQVTALLKLDSFNRLNRAGWGRGGHRGSLVIITESTANRLLTLGFIARTNSLVNDSEDFISITENGRKRLREIARGKT